LTLLLEVHRGLSCLSMSDNLRCLLGLGLHLSSDLGLLLCHKCLVPCRVARWQKLVGGQPRHL